MTYFEYDCVFDMLASMGKTQIGTKVKVVKTNNEEIILGIGYKPFVPFFTAEPTFACFFDDDFKNVKISLCDIKDIVPVLEEEEMKNPDLVFICRKCQHILFVDKYQFILKTKLPDCPNCGEESFSNWIFEREGNYDKEF